MEKDFSQINLIRKSDEELADIAQEITDLYLEHWNKLLNIATEYHFEKGENANLILNKIFATLKDRRSLQIQKFSDNEIRNCLVNAKNADLVKQTINKIQLLNKQERHQELIEFLDEIQNSTDKSLCGLSEEGSAPSNDEYALTISHLGYIARTRLSEYKRLNRNYKRTDVNILNIEQMDSYDMVYVPNGLVSNYTDSKSDFLEKFYQVNEHDHLIIFTEKGKCYWRNAFEIPEVILATKGQTIQNLLQLEESDKVCSIISIRSLTDDNLINNTYIILCTEKGQIKRTPLEAYSRPRKSGIIAMDVRDYDKLSYACLTHGESDIMLVLQSGHGIHFRENEELRSLGRTARGVTGIIVDNDEDNVIGMIALENDNKDVLLISETGYGKRSAIEDFRITHRGGKGVTAMKISEKTKCVIAIKDVTDDDDLLITTRLGISTRIHINTIRKIGRNTLGSRLINLSKGDSITSVCILPHLNENFINNNNDIFSIL